MTTVSLLLIALALSLALTLTSTEARRAKRPQTCDGNLFGKNGYDICLLGSSNTTATTFMTIAAKALFTVQEALHAAKCVCNQSCRPSQLVCKDGHLVSKLALALKIGDASVYNTLAQIMYSSENYQFHCFCPKHVPAKKACKPVANPQKCEYPNFRS